MYRQESVLKLKGILNPCLENQGFVLVDIRIYINGDRRQVLEVLIDRPQGGISLDECARLNKEMGVLIEGTHDDLGDYVLDVSSPGLDRPLVNIIDFKRAMGKKVRVFLREPIGEKLEHCGVIESAKEGKIVMNTQTAKIQIPLDKLNKAKQVIL